MASISNTDPLKTNVIPLDQQVRRPFSLGSLTSSLVGDTSTPEGSDLPNLMGTRYPGLESPTPEPTQEQIAAQPQGTVYGATTTGTPLSVNSYVAPQSLTELGNKAQNNMIAASDVINNQLTGKAFNPYALQTQQALGRAETNQRAKAASAIHSSGFSGTPLGASAGNAVESDLLRNRFDANLGIEVERQNLMNTGVGNAMSYGDAVNQLQNDDVTRAKSVFDLDRAKDNYKQETFAQAHSNVSGMLQNDELLQNYLRSHNENEGIAEVERWLNSNPRAKEDFARVFGRDYTAKDVYDFNRNMQYAESQMYAIAKAITPPGGDPNDYLGLVTDYFKGLLTMTTDADGDLQLVPTDTSGMTEEEIAQMVTQNMTNIGNINAANNAVNMNVNSGFDYLNNINQNINNQVNNQVNNAMQNVNLPNLSTPNSFDINNLYSQPTYWGGGSFNVPGYNVPYYNI